MEKLNYVICEISYINEIGKRKKKSVTADCKKLCASGSITYMSD